MITKKQYKLLSFFLSRAYFLGTGFSLLLSLTKTDTIIAFILGILLGYIFILLFYNLYSKDNKINSIILKVALTIFIIFTLNDSIFTLTTLINSFYLVKSPPLLIALAILFIVYLASRKGLVTIARVGEILFPIGLFIFIFKIIGYTPMIKLDNFEPLFNSSFKSIILGGLITAAYAAFPQILLLNIPDLNLSIKEYSKGYIIGCITLLVSFITVIGVFGFPLASMYRFPEYMILKKLSILNFLEHLENILTLTWVFDVFITCSICGYILNNIICPKKSINKYFLGFILIFVLFSSITVIRNYNIVLFLYKYTYLIILSLGLILILLYMVKKRTITK